MGIEVHLFRHGRTTWNSLGRYQGHADVELDELGRGQARAVARRCAEIDPAAVYTSDLVRCAYVADCISELVGMPAVRDERLRERDVAAWSGLTRAEIAERFPDDMARWRAGDPDVRPGGGESSRDVIARVESFVEMVRLAHLDGSRPVVAVTHSGWIRSAMEWVLGTTSRARLGVPTQGSLTVLHLEESSVRVEAFNDRGHLLEVEPVDQEPPAPNIV